MVSQKVRVAVIMAVLAVAGYFLGMAAETKNVWLFTGVLFGEAIAVGFVMRALGPVQTADERAVNRSKDAALSAVRISGVLGILAGAYASILDAPIEIRALAYGAAIPMILWAVFYFIYNWRDLT